MPFDWVMSLASGGMWDGAVGAADGGTQAVPRPSEPMWPDGVHSHVGEAHVEEAVCTVSPSCADHDVCRMCQVHPNAAVLTDTPLPAPFSAGYTV